MTKPFVRMTFRLQSLGEPREIPVMARGTIERIRVQLALDIFGVKMTGPEARAALMLRHLAPGSILPQYRVAGHRIDLAVPSLRLAVEVDGHPAHYTPDGVERDRQIDERLEIEGWTVVRLRNDQTEEEQIKQMRYALWNLQR